MKPLRLRLENFTCFRRVQEVDLAEMRLFAIAGPTGAGKSTLLDAVVFGLYGRIPRLGARKLDEFISLGESSASITLEFELQATHYRVARRMRRSGQKTAILERLQGADTIGIADGVRPVNDAVERLLGLGSEAFLQCVVLPQGEFAKFLRSDPSERRKILQELLRLQVYEEMRRRSERRRGRLWGRLETLRERLDNDYAEATPDALERCEAEAVELAEAAAAASTERGSVDKELARLEDLWALVAERADKQARLTDWEKRKPEIEKLRGRLDLARKAEAVRPYLEIWDRSEQDRQAKERELQEVDESARQATTYAQEADLQFEAADGAASQLETLREELAGLQQVLPMLEVIREKRAAAQRLSQESEETKRDAAMQSRAAAEAAETSERIEAEVRDLEKAQAEVGFDAAHLKRLAAAEESARQVLRERELHGECIDQLRSQLEPGRPCPVCRRPVKALKPSAPRQMPLDLQLEALPTEAADTPEERVLAQLRVQRQAQGRYTDLERTRVQLELKLTESKAAESQATQAHKAAVELASMRAADAAEYSTAAAQLANQIAAQPDEVEAGRGELESSIANLEKNLGAARQRRETAQLTLAREKERLSAAKDGVRTAVRSAKKALIRLTDKVVEAGIESTEGVLGSLIYADERSTLESEIREADEEVRLLQPRLAELSELIGPKPPVLDQVEAAREKAAKVAQTCERLQVEKGRLDQRLERLRRDVAQAEQLTAEHEDVERDNGLYRQLADELAGARFQAYLLDDAFSRLVAGASQRLFGLTDRYELEFRNREFTVIDREHGRETRSADTLSGGETFLASLALALELIQQVQHAAGAVRLDSIFIDEGFGTLDPETLDIVANTIENLDDGERMVGVITHVPELHNRLPSRVNVIPGAEGSTLEIWHS